MSLGFQKNFVPITSFSKFSLKKLETFIKKLLRSFELSSQILTFYIMTSFVNLPLVVSFNFCLCVFYRAFRPPLSHSQLNYFSRFLFSFIKIFLANPNTKMLFLQHSLSYHPAKHRKMKNYLCSGMSYGFI